jgi:hypothetical protein
MESPAQQTLAHIREHFLAELARPASKTEGGFVADQ